jgi:hypothetical protein
MIIIIIIHFLQLTENVDKAISPVPISNLASTELYGLEITSAGWGSPNTFQLPVLMETVNLTIITNRECEHKIKSVHGKRIPFHERNLCSTSMPPAIVTYVSIFLNKNSINIIVKY